jgi:MFS family permease
MKKAGDLNLFRAFRSRNYTLYFIGRSVSQFGTWMQRTAVVWVVYTMTHSAFWIGLTIFAEQFPSFLFSIWGGVAADRYNRYTIIKITQIVSIIQAVLLALLVTTGYAAVWSILTLSIFLGIINAFDVPARQSLIHDVVSDPGDLPNALSLTTAMASLAQLLGPALSGIVLNTWGAGVCFLINAASFGGVMLSLILMKLPPPKRRNSDKRATTEFAEGFRYLKKTPTLSTIILMLVCTSLFVIPYNTVLPVFAKVIFKGDASTFGYITSFVGVGAVVGTMFIASRKPGAHLRLILFISTLIMAIGLVCFSYTTNFALAMFFGALTGFGAIAQFTISNIIIQSESAPDMRGRVIGILLMAIFGMTPLGSLLIGAVSERIGAPATVFWEGILAAVIAISFARYLTKRGTPIPEKEMASVIETEETLVEH